MQPGQVSEELQEAEEHLAEKGVISRGDGKVDEEMGNLEKNGENTEQISSGADTASAAQQRHSKTSTISSVDSNNTATTTTTSQLTSSGSKTVLPISFSTWANEWPILAQAFTITFVAEWGDRSQIATIAMAAAQNALGITIGACIGHALVTGLAVVGGRMLSSRISERAVAIAGGSLFLIFSLHSLYVGPN
jgi:putative Ca2+/H+ antiporter (TMEM165/GDT1 family)